ncbi:MAG: FHA domain-containing protein [Myxococcales bacterium]|nr:FHA domain-containing protein [Myxococcales bacterium]
MGVLFHADSDATFTLQVRTVVGRSPVCQIRLNDPRISGEHATLSWSGQRWELRDLASSNGTFVDGARVEPGQAVPLTPQNRLSFGHDGGGWSLLDDSGPVGGARELVGDRRAVARGDLLCLPDDQEPELCVYLDRTGRWVMERGDEVTPVADQAVVRAADSVWRLFLPDPVVPTLRADTGSDLRLSFRVSGDEEYVELDVLQQGRVHQVGANTFNYLLLVLARERLADAERGTSDPGWLHQEELSRKLGLHDTTIYTQIHRARTRLAKLGVAHAASLVERRQRTRQLRIGTHSLDVHRL